MAMLDEPPTDSELERWETDGQRLEYSNIVQWNDPEEAYVLEVTVDDPIRDFLVRLFRHEGDDVRTSENRIGQTICLGAEEALDMASRFAAAADELDGVDENPGLGPEYPDMEVVEHPDYTPTPPDEWEERPEEWDQQISEAVEKAGTQRGRPTLTTKEIDDREYYYLQWRDGDTVKSQYVAPVDPA
jgi:hypothetical protein